MVFETYIKNQLERESNTRECITTTRYKQAVIPNYKAKETIILWKYQTQMQFPDNSTRRKNGKQKRGRPIQTCFSNTPQQTVREDQRCISEATVGHLWSVITRQPLARHLWSVITRQPLARR